MRRTSSRRPTPPLGVALAIVGAILAPRQAEAAVSVIANRTANPVTIRVLSPDGESALTVPPFGCRPIELAQGATAEVVSATGLAPSSFGAVPRPLLPNTPYHVAPGPAGPELRRIGLAGERAETPVPPPKTGAPAAAPIRQFVPVVVYVDEEEPTRDAVWQRRLTDRVEAASDVVAAVAGLGFRVIGFAGWESDNATRDFEESFSEFEREAASPVGGLAIGFTSQYQIPAGRVRMGGTRGALRRHILMREWAPSLAEPQRVELLAHELGHYFGAAHSPEPTSVMRPVLGGSVSVRKSSGFAFDPLNALAVAMVGRAVRDHGATGLAELPKGERSRLAQVYATLAEATPGDDAGPALQRLAAVDAARERPAAFPVTSRAAPDGRGVGEILAAITRSAARNAKLPLPPAKQAERAAPFSAAFRAEGDALSTLLVREAAREALRSPSDHSKHNLLLSIGIGLDDTDTLRSHPRFGPEARAAETEESRALRRNVLGSPTARGRRDTLQHFAISATLTAMVGPAEAFTWGFAKEAIDSQKASGFSFADLAADRAGIRFAERVLSGAIPIEAVADRFDVAHFVPPLDGLPEGLTMAEVLRRYGGKGDPRFEAVLSDIDNRLDALPPYLRWSSPGNAAPTREGE